MIFVFCSISEALRTYFNVQTLYWQFLHLSNFDLGFVADFSNIRKRVPTSPERNLSLPVWRAKWFGRMAWISVMVIFRWLFFLTNIRYPYKSSNSFLTELFDPGRWPMRFLCPTSNEALRCPPLEWSTLVHIHPAASHGFQCYDSYHTLLFQRLLGQDD